MKRIRLASLACFVVLCACSASAQNSLTIGDITFDFAAPAPPLTGAEQSFFQRYREAVNARDTGGLLALQDSAASSCKFDGREFLLKYLRYTIPADAKVRIFVVKEDLAKAAGLGSVAYMPTTPTGVLAIGYQNSTKNHVSAVQIMQPIVERGEAITLAPYCLTEKGEQLRKEKEQSKK